MWVGVYIDVYVYVYVLSVIQNAVSVSFAFLLKRFFSIPGQFFSVSLPFLFRFFHQRFFTISTVSFAFLFHFVTYLSTFNDIVVHVLNVSLPFPKHFHNVSLPFLYRFQSVSLPFPCPCLYHFHHHVFSISSQKNGKEMPAAFFVFFEH